MECAGGFSFLKISNTSVKMRKTLNLCVILLMICVSSADRTFLSREFKLITDVIGGDGANDGNFTGIVKAASAFCDGYKPAACSGCKTIDICSGSNGDSENIPCPAVTPHCAESPLGDFCSAVEQCPPEFEKITCTGAGVYPDPYECRYYHECKAAGEKSETRACSVGYVFSPTAATNCTKSTTCVKFACDSTKVWARYGTSTLYYGRCYNQTVGEVVETKIDVFKCTTGSTFDGNVCNFACTKEANIQDTNFPERYFECYKPATGYAYNILFCQSPLKFANGKCGF